MAKREKVKLRRKEVAEMYLKGHQQMQIAEYFGISQQTISHDLQVIYRMWRQSMLTDFDEMKHREVLKIDKLELTYWNAWDESREKSKTEKIKGIISDDKDKKAIPKTRESIESDSDGDPRYLQGVQWCINKRIELFGLAEATKVDVNQPLIIQFQKKEK